MPLPYGFPADLADAIRAGRKGMTIRPISRRRHAAPGETVALYQGLRTRDCRLIARVVVLANEPIVLQFDRPSIRVSGYAADVDMFAQFDGFADFAGMSNYWAELRDKAIRAGRPVHPPDRFEGVGIRWLPWAPGIFGPIVPEALDRPQMAAKARPDTVLPGLFD